MEKEIKRKKLTLSILGGTKKPKTKIEIAKAQNRNSIIIEKKNNRFSKPLNKPLDRSNISNKILSGKNLVDKLNFGTKSSEKRKLAEQRATRRLKGEVSKEVR